MSKHSSPTRRMFLKCGALLAGPIAVAAVPVVALANQRPEQGLKARIQHLEDEAAIREVHQSWLRRINAGGMALEERSIRRISADHAGVADQIEIAEDGRATGHFACTVDLETRLPDDSTLGQMAHAQGNGMLRTTERRLLTVQYVKAAGTWTVQRVSSAAA